MKTVWPLLSLLLAVALLLAPAARAEPASNVPASVLIVLGSTQGSGTDPALAKLEALREMMALRDYVDEGPVGKRRLPVLSRPDDFEEEDEARADDDDDEDFEDDAEQPSTTIDADDMGGDWTDAE